MASPRNGRREQRPAFQFYAQDFLASDSVGQMTPEEVGHYILLLCRAWVGPGLPADPERLARLMGVSPEHQRELWAGPLGDCWEERDGRLVSPRMERERELQQAHSNKRAEAGRKGGLAKAEAAQASPPVVAMPEQCSSNATPGLQQKGSKGDGMGWDTSGISSESDSERGRVREEPRTSAMARAVGLLDEVPAAVSEPLARWSRHRDEIGKPLSASSIRSLVEVGRKDAAAFQRRVVASIEGATTVLLPDPTAGNGAPGKRRTARQEDQARAHEEGEAWERILSEHIDSALAVAPAGASAANMAPRAHEDPRAAQRKPEALEGKP